MGGKWFANRGQIVQTLAAIISTCLAGVAVYFVLKSNQSLPPKTSVFYGLTAVAIFLLGIWIGRLSKFSRPVEVERPVELEKPEPKNKAEAAASGGHARIGDINVYTHPPAPTPSDFNREEIQRKKFDAVPSIDLSELAVVWLDRDEWNVFHIHRGDPPGNIRGAIISAYYDPNKSLSKSELEFIRATAKLTDKKTGEMLVVPALFWIDQGLQWTNLRAGDEKHLIVLLINNEDASAFTIANKRRSYPTTWNEVSTEEEMVEAPLPDAEYELLITFIWGRNDEHRLPRTIQLPKPSSLLSESSPDQTPSEG